MNEKPTETPDALINDVREARRRLVAKHGGLRGWVKYLRDRQKKHPEKVVPAPKQAGNLPI